MIDDSRPGNRNRLLDEMKESERRPRLWFYQCIECDKFESDLEEAIQRCPQCDRPVQCFRLGHMKSAPEDDLRAVANARTFQLFDGAIHDRFGEAQSFEEQAQSSEDRLKWFREQERIAWAYHEHFPRCASKSTWLKQWAGTRRFGDPPSSKRALSTALAGNEDVRSTIELLVEVIKRQVGVRTQRETGLTRTPKRWERKILQCCDRKGVDYCEALNALEATTPTRWQEEGCPKKYADAYKRDKWRKRIQNQKSQVVKRFLKPKKD